MTTTGDSYRNQRGLFDPDVAGYQHVTIVGAGSIGANLFRQLAVMGVRSITLWDADRVQAHNLPILQGIYRPADIGFFKVDAAERFLKRQGLKTELTTNAAFVTADTSLNGVVFACTDSMASRRAIFEAVMDNAGMVPHYWDLRVGGQQIRTIRFSPTDIEAVRHYRSARYLPDDRKVKRLPCDESAVTDPPAVVADFAVGQYRQWATRHFNKGEGVMPMAVVTQDLTTMRVATSETL